MHEIRIQVSLANPGREPSETKRRRRKGLNQSSKKTISCGRRLVSCIPWLERTIIAGVLECELSSLLLKFTTSADHVIGGIREQTANPASMHLLTVYASLEQLAATANFALASAADQPFSGSRSHLVPAGPS